METVTVPVCTKVTSTCYRVDLFGSNFLVSLFYSVLTGYVISLIVGYLPCFSFLVFVFSLSRSQTCIVGLMVPALCTCTYAIYLSFYPGYWLPAVNTRLPGDSSFDRDRVLVGNGTSQMVPSIFISRKKVVRTTTVHVSQ